jgi:hypothetical protein
MRDRQSQIASAGGFVAVECSGIRCSEKSLSEMDGRKIAVSVFRPDIRKITYRHGVLAPHPLLQILAGIILIATGYFPAEHIFRWLQNGGTLFGEELLIFIFAGIGVYLILTARRRGYFLDIELPKGRERLAFKGEPNPNELEAFFSAVEQCHGVKVLREV